MNTPPPSDDSPELAPDLLEQFGAAHGSEAPSATVAARVKRRLFARIAEDSTHRHITVPRSDEAWQPFSSGVDIKVLNEAGGVMSYLLRLAPGASFPSHRHPIDETCLVLEGTIQIGTELVVSAGGFHLALRDSVHAPVTTVAGATIYLQGASPHPADLV